MCADKAGLALGLCFEKVTYSGESKPVFTTSTTLEAVKSKINITTQSINKLVPQPIKKKPAPQSKGVFGSGDGVGWKWAIPILVVFGSEAAGIG